MFVTEPIMAWGVNSSGEAASVIASSRGGLKRRILPDGRQIFATEQEAVNALMALYEAQKLKPSEAAVIGKPPNRKKKVIVLPSERQQIHAAIEVLEEVDYDQIRRMTRRQEEEWLILAIH